MQLLFNQDCPLSGEGLRGWLRGTFFPKLGEDNSGASLLSALREQGAKIKTADFYSIRRQTLGLKVHEESIRKAATEQLVPHAYINQKHGLDLNADFHYRMVGTGINPQTGEETKVYYSWGSNTELTPTQAKSVILDAISADPNDYKVIVSKLDLFQVLAKPQIVL